MTQADHPELPRLPGLTDLSVLGQGGFAVVYRARQEILGRWVAVKVFRVTLDDPVAAEQFQAECQRVQRIDDHPNVIKVFDADVLPDRRPYLMTELCDGSLMQIVTRRGALPSDEVADIGYALASGLLAAHSAGVLHGDVTPQNVLLRRTGTPVLADFGLAVLRDYRGNVASGFTPEHAAPETVRFDGAIDRPTDVYGLGSTLYTALTGRPPFPQRPGEDDADLVRRILTEPPVRPTGIPDRIADLVMAMLAKDPDRRPSLLEVAEAMAGRSAAAPPAPAASTPVPPPPVADPETPGGTRRRPAAPAPVPGPAPAEATRRRPREPDTAGAPQAGPDRRRRTLVLAAAAAAVALLGGAAAVSLSRSPDAGATPPAASVPAAPPQDSGDSAAPSYTITLASPEDLRDAVMLTWTADTDAVVTYNVIIGQPDGDTRSELVGRTTSMQLPVEPGRPYCFLVQGSTATAEVVESNVRAIRGAVCRFDS